MLRDAGWALGALALYVALGRASLELATVHFSSSPVWPPAGLAIGLLILAGPRMAPVVAIGAFLVNLLNGSAVDTAAIIALGNTAEACAAAWLVLRMAPTGNLPRMSGAFLLLGAATVGAAISASIGLGALVRDGLPSDMGWDVWRTWFLGNLAGTLVVAPILMTVRRATPAMAAAALVGTAAGVAAFWTEAWSLLVLLPVLGWMVVRLPRDALAVGMLGVASGAVAMTLNHHGPFWGRGENEALLLLQLFLVTLAFTMLSLSAGMHHRARPSPMSWAQAMLALAPLVAAATFIGVVLQPTIASLEAERQGAEADHLVTAWQEAIEGAGQQLQTLRALYAVGPVGREPFDTFVSAQDWQFGPGGVTAMGFARVVEPEDQATYEATVRNDTRLPAPVREAFSIFPPTNATAIVVDHVFPMDPQPGAIGFNLRADPAGAAALDLAAASDVPIATPPVDLVTPSGMLPGFFTSLPVWEDGELIGFVVLAETVADAAAHVEADTTYRIDDVAADQQLHATGNGSWNHVETLDAWGRSWRISMELSTTTTRTETHAPWFVLTAGAVLSAAMAGVVYAHDTTRARARAMSHDLVQRARLDADRLAEIRRLEDRDDFRRQFLNMVAHELRTPLTPIQTQAYILRARADEAGRRSLDILDRGVKRLQAVVEDLLVAAKLESQGMALQLAPTDIQAVVQEAATALQAQAAAEGTQLTVSGKPVIAPVDGSRLAQVIDNLLTNALKFAKGGHVDVNVLNHGDEVEIRIQDDGIGIAAEDIAAVGQPFVQVHDVDQIGVKGTGLGLYICKSIVELHQGRLTVRSNGPGEGTTVTVRLPRESDAEVDGTGT